MTTILQDLRYALRTLIGSPGFAAVAIATLALGIGANSAIFTVVDAVLLRPLAYHEPERLVRIAHAHAERGAEPGAFSPQDFQDLKRASTAFAQLAAWWFTPGQSGLNLTGGEPERLDAAMVSGELFATLGVPAALGRTLLPAEEAPGRDRVAVLSDGLWRRRFGADPKIVGSAVTLDGEPFTVVGVMPPSFALPSREVDVWVPISLIDEGDIPHRRGLRWMQVVGRLAPGASLAAADQETDAILARLAAQYPETNEGWGTAETTPLHESVVGDVRPALLVLLGAVALVLLIACANLANLLLARSTARRREIAIRAALGAGRGRLLAQLLTESLVLALLGGGLGLVLAMWGVDALVALAAGHLPRPDEIEPDARVLAFTLLVSVGTGLVFGLVPAMKAAGLDPRQAFQDGGRGTSAGRHGLRGALVVAETALAVVLLAGAGLMVKSLWRLLATDPGFAAENVLALSIAMPDSDVLGTDGMARYRGQVLARIAELPGVVAVGAAKTLPLHGGGEPYEFSIPGRVGADSVVRPESGVIIVTPGYFRALGIPLLAGRDFTDQDDERAPGVVVNRELARQYWPGVPAEEVVGETLALGEATISVIGLVGDVRNDGLAEAPGSALYIPATLAPRSTVKIFVRTAREPLAMVSAVREAIWRVNRDQPISQVATLDQVIAEAAGRPRLFTSLLGLFGGLAVVLAALGIYGVISYAVRQRTREIGIRMALGARRSDVVKGVVARTMALAGAGLLLGLAGALALTRVLAGLLYEVSATDPATFAGVALFLAAIALLAGWLPARRASSIDPMVVLKAE